MDVASVRRGNKCGCICPSCKTPLIARQGQSKEWHFAHRSRNVHNEIRKECDYSFAVSVRLMIRQLSTHGLKFRTPGYVDFLEAYSEISRQYHRIEFVVTEGSFIVLSNPQIGVSFSRAVVDILGYVSDVPFIVYITYKDRTVPTELNPPQIRLCGIVEIGIDGLLKAFKQEKEGRYIEVLKAYMEEKIDGKLWVYHPRAARARKQAEAKMAEWLLQQKPSRAYRSEVRSMSGSNASSHSVPIEQKPSMLPERKVEHYECVKCGAHWSGTSQHCDICDTHLFTRLNKSAQEK